MARRVGCVESRAGCVGVHGDCSIGQRQFLALQHPNRPRRKEDPQRRACRACQKLAEVLHVTGSNLCNIAPYRRIIIASQ
eukprot:6212700-Pleurochrysis_carterae.AAC.4